VTIIGKLPYKKKILANTMNIENLSDCFIFLKGSKTMTNNWEEFASGSGY
jgi:hypothetical protein